MITIDQLLESVDLDFEPRFVTKNKNGGIYVWEVRPIYRSGIWFGDELVDSYIAKLKLAEFEGKSSGECIYEVPRKTTGKIEKLKEITSIGYPESATHEIILELNKIIKKQNELVDAVNELKSRAENVQPDIKKVQPPCVRLYACSDGVVFDNEDMAKSHEASLKSKQSMN